MRKFVVNIDDGLYHIIRQLARLQCTYRGDNEEEVVQALIRYELVNAIYERLTNCPALLENARVHFANYEKPSRLYTETERWKSPQAENRGENDVENQ